VHSAVSRASQGAKRIGCVVGRVVASAKSSGLQSECIREAPGALLGEKQQVRGLNPPDAANGTSWAQPAALSPRFLARMFHKFHPAPPELVRQKPLREILQLRLVFALDDLVLFFFPVDLHF